MIGLSVSNYDSSNIFTTNNDLKTKLFVSRIYGTIVTCLLLVSIFGYMRLNNASVDKVNELDKRYNTLVQDTNYANEQMASMADTIVKLVNISYDLEDQNTLLKEENMEMISLLDTYAEREELLNKYEYALFDKANLRTDITYEQCATVEQMVEDSDIPDTDLILALVMTESGGNEDAKNATSTAKGYGQILDGTSKFVYTKLLNKTDWKASVALDGDTNLEMVVAYVDYLYDSNGNNLMKAIRSYRGIDNIDSYVATMNTYLSTVDKSVNTIIRNSRQ